LADATGDEAVVIGCQAALAIIAAAGWSVAEGAADVLGSAGKGDCIAFVALSSRADASTVIASLAALLRNIGDDLVCIGLPQRGAAAAAAKLGLSAIADGTISAPGGAIELYLRPPGVAELQTRLVEDRPNPIPEPADNLERRAEWFQRRSGRKHLGFNRQILRP
jgi:hypothetical protein